MALDFARRLAVAACAMAGVLLGATNASAHAHLESAAPAPDSNVAAPATVTLHFTEALEPRFSGFEIADAHGARVNAPSGVGQDPATLVATPAAPLAAGAYTVTWHIVARDGHRMRGTYAFTVH